MRKTRRVLSLFLAVAMVLSTLMGLTAMTASAITFTDTNGHWAESEINTWSTRGVLNGYEDGSFRPDDNISRAELTKIVVSVKNVTNLSATTFSDVPSTEWYSSYISRGVAAGYVNGYEDGTFLPDNAITRQEASAIFARAYSLADNGDVSRFTDASQIESWAVNYVGALVQAGAINGYDDGTFRPLDYITRAEVVAILDRLEAMENSSTSDTVDTILGGGVWGGSSGGSTGGSTGSSSSSIYTVTFISDGSRVGSVDVRNNQTIGEGNAPVPVKDGYVLAGWYTSETAAQNLDASAQWDVANDRVTSRMNLYAGWTEEANTALVTFKYNNGSADYVVRAQVGEQVSPAILEPERPNHTFAGWYSSADGSGSAVTMPYEVTSTNSVTFYAIYTLNEGVDYVEGVEVGAPVDSSGNPIEGITVTANTDLTNPAVGETVAIDLTVSDNRYSISNIGSVALTYTNADGTAGEIALPSDSYIFENNRLEITIPSAEELGVSGDVTYDNIVITPTIIQALVPTPTAAPPTPAPTLRPGDPTPTPAPVAHTWDFNDEPFVVDGAVNTSMFPEGSHVNSDGQVDRFNVTSTSIVDVYGLTYVVDSVQENAVQSTSREFDDGYATGWSIKTNGAGSESNRVFTYTPTSSGTLTIWATSGSGSSDSTLTVRQNGRDVASNTYSPGEYAVWSVDGLVAGQEIRLVSGGNTQYFKLEYVEDNEPEPTPVPTATAGPASPDPDQTYTVSIADGITGGTVKIVNPNAAAPTTEPAEPTQVPAEPTSAPTQAPVTTPAAGSYEYFMNENTPVSPGGQYYTYEDDLLVGTVYETTLDQLTETVAGEDGTTTEVPITKNIAGREVSYYINVRLQADYSGGDVYSAFTDGSGNSRTPIVIRPVVDGEFTIYYRRQVTNNDVAQMVAGDGKDMRLSKDLGSSAELIVGDMNMDEIVGTADTGGMFAYGTQTYQLEAESKYVLWTRGTTGVLFGYTFVPNEAQTAELSEAELAADGDQFVDTLEAKAGDTITLYAEAANPGDEITISTSPETEVTAVADQAGYYTFTMPASDVTVNAQFTAPVQSYTVSVGTITGNGELKIVQPAAATAEPTQEPVATEEPAEPTAPAEEPTEEPTEPTQAPSTDAITWTFVDAPEGTKITGMDGTEREYYVTNADLGNGLTAYSNGSLRDDNRYNNAFEIDRDDEATFTNEETVVGALKTGGSSSSDARFLTYTPQEAGTFTVYAKHGSPSGTDTRTATITQGSSSVNIDTIGSTENQVNVIGSMDVIAGTEVSVTANGNMGFAKIVFTPAAAETASLADDEVLVDSMEATAGDTITVKATTKEAQTLIETVPAAEVTDIGGGYYTFTMPDENTTVNATFSTTGPQTYTVSVGEVVGNGELKIVQPAVATAEPTEEPVVTEEPAEPTAPAEEPTEEPTEPTQAPSADAITWTFADAPDGEKLANKDGKEKEWYISNVDLGNGLTAYSNGALNTDKQEYSNAFEVDRTSEAEFTVGGATETVTGALKFGGKSSSDGRYFTYTPASDGTLTLYVKHGSPSKGESDVRSAIVEQNGKSTQIPTYGTEEKAYVVQDVAVTANSEVKISCDNNVALAKLIYTPSSESTASLAEDEVLVDSMEAMAGDTITVKATTTEAQTVIETVPAAEVTDIGGGYYTFTMPAADTTVNATFGEAPQLPQDKLWRADSSAAQSSGYDGSAAVTIDGATVGPNLVYTARSVNYTHPDGQSYTFTRAFQGGSGSETSRYISIVPEAAACTVTVVFDGHGKDGRVQYIYYNGEKLGETYSAGDVSAVTADITKATIEANPGVPIITYGGGSNKNVYAIFIEYYVETPNKFLSGNVENATGRDFTGKNMIFTNIDDPNETYTVEYGTSYNIELPKGKTFSVTIEGEPDVCTTTDSSEIEILHNRYDQTQNLRFVLIENMPVSGTVSTISSHDTRTPLYDYDSSIGATLVFTKQGETQPYAEAAVGADGAYTATLISNETYDVTLKEGTGEGYTLSPLSTTYVFEAGDENPYKNILLMKDVEPEIAYDAELTVGADKEYPSISEAIAAVRRMENSRNDQTVTIVVDPGTYEEQLYIDENNIVLKAANPDDRPMIQWYYGIGYVYYSADPSGWYDADWAAQKTEQRTVSNWGATIRTYGVGFLAENLDVQNTFNKFIVQAELDDGVQPGGGDAKNYDRTARGLDTVVNSQAATERAAAIFAGGSEIELYRCSFSSSQDTFGTGASSMYVKECEIGGGTDYICGGNNVYFEDCDLVWTGYSDSAKGGYITASKTSNTAGQPGSDLGYYFKNCTVKYDDDPNMRYAPGMWGRNWGGAESQTIFDTTTIADGTTRPQLDEHGNTWNTMGGPLSDSVIYVVGGVWAESDVNHTNDLTINRSNGGDNPNGTVESNNYILPEANDFFGDWTPVHYVDDSNRLNIEAAPAENGSVNFSVGGRLVTRAAEGEEVTIVPNPDPNYQLDTVSVKGAVSGTDVEVTDNAFVMPNENVIVTTTFKPTEAQPATDPTTMVGDVEWYFGISNNSGKIDISGATGQIASRASASGDDGAIKYLEIDATAEGARIDNKDNNDTTGYRRDEWAAITTGTKISIPVMKGSIVTVRGYGDGAEGGKNLAYTINGEAKVHVSQGDQTYVYTGEAGFIDLIVTYGRYISYIKVNTPKPLEGKYSDWNVGHANDSRDGELQTVTYEGQESLYIANRNAYKVIENPISSGVATFDFDLYIDTAVDRNFRVYLENEVGDIVNQDNVFAEVINNRGSGVNYGPDLDALTTKLFSYSDLTQGSGWVHFTIKLDYNNAATDQFVTVTATNEAGLSATQTMGAISGKDTTLKQIRLVATAQSPYFANMKLTTE